MPSRGDVPCSRVFSLGGWGNPNPTQAFQRVKPDERKVQLDDRFKAVLTDPRFQVSDGELLVRVLYCCLGVYALFFKILIDLLVLSIC